MKALRLEVGDTQQQFAQRMCWAISSVVRYETSRTIQGVALVQTERLAWQHHYGAIAEQLRNCIRKDMCLEDALFARMVEDVNRKGKS